MSTHELGDDVMARIVADVPDAVIVVDASGTIIHANGSVEHVLGYLPAELIDAAIDTLLPESARAVHHKHMTNYATAPRARPMGVGLELRARRRDGSEIPVEVALVPMQGAAGLTAAFVRDISPRRRLIDRLTASNEVLGTLAAGHDRDEILVLSVRLARQLVGATSAWVVVDDGAATVETVVELAGEHSDATVVTLSGPPIPPRPGVRTGEGAVDELADIVGSGSTGPWIAAPLTTSGRGALVVAREHGAPSFEPIDAETCEQFATLIGVALELISTRHEAHAAAIRVSIMDDHERIARDLHDTVIQSVFAEGLRLQALADQAGGAIGGHLAKTIDILDEVIRSIRSTIFELQTSDDQHGLRTSIANLAEEMTRPAGLQARVAVGDDVDRCVPPKLVDISLAVIREALSNIARHARASKVEVIVAVEGGHLSLTVVDDGVGPPDHPTAGLGLVSLQARALELGGSFTMRPATAGGTVVHWMVPLNGTDSNDGNAQ